MNGRKRGRRKSKARMNKERGQHKKRQASEMRDAELRTAARMERRGFMASALWVRRAAAEITDDPVWDA